MSSPVEEVLAVLHANRKLVSELFASSLVEPTLENQKGIEELHRLMLVVRKGQAYSLHSEVRSMLSHATRKPELYRVDANIAAHVDLLREMAEALVSACLSGDHERRDSISDELRFKADAIVDAVDGEVRHVLNNVENHFGRATALDQRERENLEYLERVARIIQALDGLDSVRDLDEDVPQLLDDIFESHLGAALAEVRQRLFDAIEGIKKNLFKVRAIRRDAQLVRGIARHLRRNPQWQPPSDLPELEALLWARLAPRQAFIATPDLSDEDTARWASEIVAKLPARTIAVRDTREAGKLSRRDNERAVVRVMPRPHQIGVDRFVRAAHASGTPISALRWWQAEGGEQFVRDARGWIYAVLGRVAHYEGRGDTTFRVVFKERRSLCGPIVIQDVIVSKSGKRETRTTAVA